MDNAIAIAGVATKERPFSRREVDKNAFIILYNKELFFSITSITDKDAEVIEDHFNEAYQRGFHKCGTMLLTESMNNKINLTCNQAMVLLDIYRGTFDFERHLGTVSDDVNVLIKNNLIKQIDHSTHFVLQITEAGNNRISTILN